MEYLLADFGRGHDGILKKVKTFILNRCCVQLDCTFFSYLQDYVVYVVLLIFFGQTNNRLMGIRVQAVPTTDVQYLLYLHTDSYI